MSLERDIDRLKLDFETVINSLLQEITDLQESNKKLEQTVSSLEDEIEHLNNQLSELL